MQERRVVLDQAAVRAIEAGRQGELRRPIRQAHDPLWGPAAVVCPAAESDWVILWTCGDTPRTRAYVASRYTKGVPCPYGARGDRLWVAETWRPCRVPQCPASPCYEYAATGYCRAGHMSALNRTGWRSPMVMPRAAGRLLLEITDVQVAQEASAQPWVWVLAVRVVAAQEQAQADA